MYNAFDGSSQKSKLDLYSFSKLLWFRDLTDQNPEGVSHMMCIKFSQSFSTWWLTYAAVNVSAQCSLLSEFGFVRGIDEMGGQATDLNQTYKFTFRCKNHFGPLQLKSLFCARLALEKPNNNLPF